MNLKSYPRVYYELLFIGFSIFLGMRLSGAFLPILASELDPTGGLVGYVVSAWFLARIFVEIPSGFLSDQIGRRKLFLIGVALSATGALLCATAQSIYFLIVGRALWGFGAALFFSNNTAILIDMFDSEHRGRAVGTFQGIEFIGSLIGAPIGAFLAELGGYYFVFYLTFALISISCLLSFFSKGLKSIGAPKESAGTFKPTVFESLSSIIKWELLVLCVISFSRMFIMNGVMSTVFPLYLHEGLGFEVSLIGIVTAARTVGFITATFVSGNLSDKIGRRSTIMIGLVIEAVCLGVYTVLNSLLPILAVGVIDGLGAGLVSVTLTVLLSDIAEPAFRGISIGLFRTFMDAGGIVGPIVFMALAKTINVQTPFYAAAVILVAMAFIITRVKNKQS
jgi:MFS family permease